jgi:ankyrin repeat protein
MVIVIGKDEYGRTPLMWASEKGHTGIVNVLLKKGVNIHEKDQQGWTSLMAASQGGHPEIVELLIEKGADLNAKDDSGRPH